MKQFDKWYEGEVGPINFPGIKEFYEARKKTWRAALGWVKKEAISLDERGDISREIIDRELKGDD
ncbi:hypothetical protein LCGC14_0875440 [marine sediment metagenome]|uniref:Uncharacterized protein n=1 Tax=marine sediment metagenome TaxID=412755 RepID=A0A0F9P8F5_9ZZZZ